MLYFLGFDFLKESSLRRNLRWINVVVLIFTLINWTRLIDFCHLLIQKQLLVHPVHVAFRLFINKLFLLIRFLFLYFQLVAHVFIQNKLRILLYLFRLKTWWTYLIISWLFSLIYLKRFLDVFLSWLFRLCVFLFLFIDSI